MNEKVEGRRLEGPAPEHFNRMAPSYHIARPPYPDQLYQALSDHEVIGHGARVLEIGPGTGQATRHLLRAGCHLVAVEPGARLADLLRQDHPTLDVREGPIETVPLEPDTYDSVVAATSMHWVDLDVALPRLHSALGQDGKLAVWRHVFGDHTKTSPFRDRVQQIVDARPSHRIQRDSEAPSMDDLATGGWFSPVTTLRWRWAIELSTEQVHRLFSTFSDWRPDEVDQAARAVDQLGGTVIEHYQTVLHIVRRAWPHGLHDQTAGAIARETGEVSAT